MKTKIISTVLTATLIFSSLIISGCNKSTDKQQSSNNSVAESSVNSTESVSEKSPDEKSSDKQSDNENSVVSDDVSEQNSEPVESKVTPTVWEVTDSNNNSLYMMGTIHLADKDALVLPDYFEAAYAKCDALAVECDITSTDIDISSFSKYMYTDGTSIKDHVPEEQYNIIVNGLKEIGQYTAAFDYMKPIMWIDYIEIAAAAEIGLSQNYGIDYNMITRAKKEGKEILELESVDFQFNLLANISDDIQAFLFKEIAHEGFIEEYKNELSKNYDQWKNGEEIDYNEISEVSSETSYDKNDLQMAEDYNNILVYNRNTGMEEKIKSYMNDGKKVMVLAGMAHFYGDKGIIKLLKDDGYTIRKLTSKDAEGFIPAEQSSESESTQSVNSGESENDPGIPKAA